MRKSRKNHPISEDTKRLSSNNIFLTLEPQLSLIERYVICILLRFIFDECYHNASNANSNHISKKCAMWNLVNKAVVLLRKTVLNWNTFLKNDKMNDYSMSVIIHSLLNSEPVLLKFCQSSKPETTILGAKYLPANEKIYRKVFCFFLNASRLTYYFIDKVFVCVWDLGSFNSHTWINETDRVWSFLYERMPSKLEKRGKLFFYQLFEIRMVKEHFSVKQGKKNCWPFNKNDVDKDYFTHTYTCPYKFFPLLYTKQCACWSPQRQLFVKPEPLV